MPQTTQDMRSEMARLSRENQAMRTALINYYQAEEAYEQSATPQFYGTYQKASRELIALAKKLARTGGCLE